VVDVCIYGREWCDAVWRDCLLGLLVAFVFRFILGAIFPGSGWKL
jgi:hypothetical protein